MTENPHDASAPGADDAPSEAETLPPTRSFVAGCVIGLGLLFVATPCIVLISGYQARQRAAESERRFEELCGRLEAFFETSRAPLIDGAGQDFSGQLTLFEAGFEPPAEWLDMGLMVDGWGHPFSLRVDGARWRLISCGPNGRNDGGGFDDFEASGALPAGTK